jgi:DNA polymerase-1
MSTVISTSDKDMAQLVEDRVTLVNTMNETTMDAAGVREKFGVGPEQIIDFLTLVGDTSDNIPGVHGVGPKTAAKWLNEYRNLHELQAHSENIAGKAGESLRDSAEDLPLYRELVTIRCDVPLPLEPGDLMVGEPDAPRLRSLFTRLELNSLLRRLGFAGEDSPTVEPARQYQTVLTTAALETWLKRIESAELVALDTETTSLDYMAAELVGISLSV